MKCAFGTNCVGCKLTDHCPIYKEWVMLNGIGFKDNKINELIDLVKNVLGLFNIINRANLNNKKNQEQFSGTIFNLQDKLSRLRNE